MQMQGEHAGICMPKWSVAGRASGQAEKCLIDEKKMLVFLMGPGPCCRSLELDKIGKTICLNMRIKCRKRLKYAFKYTS
jgi:hypothetical protein